MKFLEWTVCAAAGLAVVGGAGTALAHHAEAPHYIMDRTIQIEATVRSFRYSNPHSALALTVNGQSWVCETFGGIGAMQRVGISRTTFKRGDKVSIKGYPGRHDPRLCEALEVRTADGKVYQTGRLPPAPQQAEPTVARQNTTLFGVWQPAAQRPGPSELVNAPAPGAGAGRSPLLDKLTPAGRKAVLAYDPYRDDPARRCSPVAPQRLWAAPGSPFSFTRQGQTIVMRHEFMDTTRIIHLDQKDHSKAGARAVLGHSIGRFEGDTLVVDTANFAPGVVLQYVLDGEGKMRGVLRSDAFHVVERLRVMPTSGELEVSVDAEDPKYYTQAFPQERRTYRTSTRAIGKFDCTPDVDVARRVAAR